VLWLSRVTSRDGPARTASEGCLAFGQLGIQPELYQDVTSGSFNVSDGSIAVVKASHPFVLPGFGFGIVTKDASGALADSDFTLFIRCGIS
jgi:hypothetical protein